MLGIIVAAAPIALLGGGAKSSVAVASFLVLNVLMAWLVVHAVGGASEGLQNCVLAHQYVPCVAL
jgi:hypothetical protein